jgi:arsenate reductase
MCSGSSSCRSIMAQAILRDIDSSLEVYSCSLNQALVIDPFAIKVMDEIGIDISSSQSVDLSEIEGKEIDYLITLCEGTKDKIASTNIVSRHKIHLGFEDPKKNSTSDEQMLRTYRNIRDEIQNELDYFYNRVLKSD